MLDHLSTKSKHQCGQNGLREDRTPKVTLHLWRTYVGIIIIINPLTARVVEAPQMILQPVFSIFLCFPLPLGLAELQACPFSDVVFPPLPLSALSSSPFHCALQISQAWNPHEL